MINIPAAAKIVKDIAAKDDAEAKLEWAPTGSDYDFLMRVFRGGDSLPLDIEQVRDLLRDGKKPEVEQYVRATIALLPPPVKEPEKEPDPYTVESDFIEHYKRIMKERDKLKQSDWDDMRKKWADVRSRF